MKLKSLLQDCYINSIREIKPGDPLYPNTLERNRGKVSKVVSIETAVQEASRDLLEGEVPENVENAVKKRIDDLFRQVHIRTFYYIQHIGNYFVALFSVKTKDKNFRRQINMIWPDLIRKFYFGSVYLGHGEDLLKLDKGLIRDECIPDGKLKCPFRLYTKIGENKYRSVYAQQNIDEDLKHRVVKFWVKDENYWLEWWHVLTEYFGGLERTIYSALAAHKRGIASIDGGAVSFVKEMQCFDDPLCVIHRNGMTSSIQNAEGGVNVENTYEPFEFMPVDAPSQFLQFYKTLLESKTDVLGYMQKGSPHKKERLTENESNTGINVVSQIQEFLRKLLESFFDECRETFTQGTIPEDLEIVITNRSANEAILDPVEKGKIINRPHFDIDG